jgi:signal transduction histidine kinase
MRRIVFFLIFCVHLFRGQNLLGQKNDSLLFKADLLYSNNDYSSAQKVYIQALKTSEQKQKLDDISKATYGIALCHYYLRDKPTGIKWLGRAQVTALKSKTDTLLPSIYYFKSVMYTELGEVDSAEMYFERAVSFWEQEKNYAKLANAYLVISDLHLNTTLNVKKAKETIAKGTKYANLSQSKKSMAFAAMKNYFFQGLLMKDYSSALPFVSEAEKLYTELNDREGIAYAYAFKAECLAKLGDSLAADYFWKWFYFKDSIFNLNKVEDLAKFETIYETEKKEKENSVLQHEVKNNRQTIFILIVLVAFLVILSLWYLNRNQLKKKEQELISVQNMQKDKERIARDLHDHVGGQLSYIIYSLDGLQDENEEKRTEIIQSVNTSVRGVISSLRETIWAISDSNIPIEDFSDKLKLYARTLFKHNKTQIHYIENISFSKELNALQGLNLFRICQEIITNAFKYAQAEQLKIEINSDEKNIRISIVDNGVGFDINQTKKEHYGIQNMHHRANEFGILLTCDSSLGKGTNYTIVTRLLD